MNRKPKILMFAPYCYPPASPEAIVTSKLVLAMLGAGWRIDVITQSAFGLHNPPDCNSRWEPVQSVAYQVPAFKDGGLMNRISLPLSVQSLSWAVKASQRANLLMKNHKYDCILSRATPLYGHMPAFAVARRTGLPWIACWSDPLPPKKAPPPYGGGAAAAIPFHLEKYCSAVAKRADWHVFPCERLRQYVSSYLPGITEKSSAIPHVMLPGPLEGRHSDARRFSLCHVGGLSNRNPRNFLAALERFTADDSRAVSTTVSFVGSGTDELQTLLARSERLQRIVTVDPPRTHDEVQAIMSRSTVLLVLEALCEEGIFFPSKFVEYVETGKPILAISPKKGTVADLLAQYGGGILADNASQEAIFQALLVLDGAWLDGELDQRYGSARLRPAFEPVVVLGLYEAIIDHVTGKN